MRILHVFEIGLVGGAFRVIQELSVAQRRAGLEPAVLAVAEGEAAARHPILDALREEGVVVVPLVLDRARDYLRERSGVLKEARRLRSGVVHTHDYRTAVVDGLSARMAGLPTVSTLHGFTDGGWRNRLYEKLHRWAVRRGDAVVAVSEPMRQRLLQDGFPPARLHMVRNAIPPRAPLLGRTAARAALGVPEGGFRVGWVGRVSMEKGPDLLLEAIRRLGAAAPAVSMVGEGRMRRALAGQTPKGITWHGPVHGADTLFRAFDALVLSSRTEGTPMVLLESMRAGVPVIATRVGGIPDVVSEREALIVPPEDPGALAAAIRRVMEDPVAAQRRAEAARVRLEQQLAPEQWVEAYRNVYESAIAHRNRTAG